MVQALKALFVFIARDAGVKFAIGGVASAALVAALQWVQTPEGATYVGGAIVVVQMFTPTLKDAIKRWREGVPPPADPPKAVR